MLKDFSPVNVMPSVATSALDTPLAQLSTAELAQTLLARLSISDKDWHRLKSNRKARASEQVAAALVFLLKDQPDEAIARLNQAVGWLDRSISAPPCEHRTAASKPPQSP
jgi:Family of unknown function (DUF6439)